MKIWELVPLKNNLVSYKNLLEYESIKAEEFGIGVNIRQIKGIFN